MLARPALRAMVSLRIACATVEMLSAFLMLGSTSVRSSLRINAVLGLFGPAVFLAASAIGLTALARESRVSIRQVSLLVLGVLLVALGTI